jgi:hypothetical protein
MKNKLAGCQWLTPIILAIQEAEIRRIAIQSQPQSNSPGDPISKISYVEKGWWSDSRGRAPAKQA